jgi:hypothetical protein
MATFIVAGRCDGTDTPMSDSMWVSFRETIADALAETLGEPDAEVTTMPRGVSSRTRRPFSSS